jgi:hypothetical protein
MMATTNAQRQALFTERLPPIKHSRISASTVAAPRVVELIGFDATTTDRFVAIWYRSLPTAKALAGAIAAAVFRRERAAPRRALFAQPPL